jgi:urease beta subunit
LRRVPAVVAGALALAFASAACSADQPPPPSPAGPAMVVVENASQYTLVELRFHPELSYASATNVLDRPLDVGDTHLEYLDASAFVTVFREKFAGGDLLALTTQTPVSLQGGTGYRVKVFDLSFRVLGETYVKPSTTSTVPDR